MTGHTKGKWVAIGTDVMLEEQPGVYSGKRICKAQKLLAFEKPIPKAEAEANARLIAASPKMFEVLEEVERCLKVELTTRGGSVRMITAKQSVDKILKKVKGE